MANLITKYSMKNGIEKYSEKEYHDSNENIYAIKNSLASNKLTRNEINNKYRTNIKINKQIKVFKLVYSI